MSGITPPVLDQATISRWARRAMTVRGDEQAAMLAELSADVEFASRLLDRLADSDDPILRAWAGTAAAGVHQARAIPLLTRLMDDASGDVRDSARQDLIAIDPAQEERLLPTLRRILRRRTDPWGEDRAAMWRVARLRDRASVPILRAYATASQPPHYHHRMSLVLADYIEDPSSVAVRIASHDHECMFWLLEATALLPQSETREAIDAALALPLDDACAALLRARRPT